MAISFNTDTIEDWESRILKELKGAPIEQAYSQTRDGIEISPFYHREHLERPIQLGRSAAWRALQEFTQSEHQNALIHEALMAGVDCISVVTDDFEQALEGVHLKMIELELGGQDFHPRTLELIEAHGLNLSDLKGGYAWDPIGGLILTGEFAAIELMPSILPIFHQQVAEAKDWYLVNVGGDIFHNAGATAVQELAYTLGTVHSYLDVLPELAQQMRVTLGAGTSYFETVAKFRAFRILWANLMKHHGADAQLTLQARSSTLDMAPTDHESNLLRATVQCTAAVAGGIDRMSIRPFNGEESAFSMRMSRNIQALMQHESYFDKCVDPSQGAYLFEQMTRKYASQAWELFRSMEQQGGFLAAVASGEVKEQVQASAEAYVSAVNSGERTWLGMNKFPPPGVEEWKGLALTSHGHGLPSIEPKSN